MLGLGLSQYIPYVLYGAFFIAAVVAFFSRSELGILFIAPLLPVYAVVSKTLKLELPFANNTMDILLAAVILGAILQREKRNEISGTLAPSSCFVPIFIFAAYSLLTFIIGTSYLGSGLGDELTIARLADWKNYMIMPLLYVLSYYTLRERKWKYALFILLAISLLAADFKFRQTYRWFGHTHFTHKMRIGGTFGFLGPNEWGSFHAIYTLFILGLFILDKNLKRRIAYGILIAGGVYSMMYSFSRGAYAGFIAGVCFIAAAKKKKLLIPIALLFIFWSYLLPTAVVERIQSTFVDNTAPQGDISFGGEKIYSAGRGAIWENAMKIFSQNPLFGSGFRTFGVITGRDSHNQYLKALAEEGIIGLLIYLWLYWLALKSGWRLYKMADEQLLKAFGFAFVCAVVGSMVVNFFGDRWTYLQLGGLYWIFWGLVDQENSKIRIKELRESHDIVAS